MMRRTGMSAVLLLATFAFVVFWSEDLPQRDKKEPAAAARIGVRTWVAAMRVRAELGSVDAQYKLADIYLAGSLVKQDTNRAAKWLLRAAERGHVEAQYRLGHHYSVGNGVPRSDAETVRWWERAANAGHLQAANYLAGFHHDGTRRPVNAAETVRWWRVLHASGRYFTVGYKTAWAVSRGWGVPRDPREAAALLKAEIAASGASNAMCDLGVLYATGEGVERDSAEAVRLWQRAVDRRGPDWPLPVCWHGLCTAYATGEGASRDVAKAAKWCDRTIASSINADIRTAPSDPSKMTYEMSWAVETARLVKDARLVRDRLAPELKKLPRVEGRESRR
jgi:hypothetical protein